MFPLVSGRHIAVHTKLYKFTTSWIVFPNISHLKYCRDLILAQMFCIFIFSHFPYPRRSVLNGLHFYFSLRDCANRESWQDLIANGFKAAFSMVRNKYKKLDKVNVRPNICRKQSENFSEEKAPVNDSQCQEILWQKVK